MATPDFEIIKEIPGYKVILKAVLKNQIQQLVEQLATYTDEESVILTASISDGTLSHLGSTSGKSFLEDHEDVKSQFLGFCLKAHHRKKLEEKLEMERQEALLVPTNLTRPARFAGARTWRGYSPQSESYMSPQQPLHPVNLVKTSRRGRMRSPGVRHEPYSITKPSLNMDSSSRGQGTALSSAETKLDGRVIKIEPNNDDSDEASNQCNSNVNNQNTSSKQQPSSPSQNSSSIRNSSSENDDKAPSESSPPVDPSTEALPEGLNLESDLSNLISDAQSFGNAPQTSGSGSDTGHIVSVKVEAVTESDMDLEITGIELARPVVSEDNWIQNVNSESPGGAINFDPSENQGSIMTISPMGSYKIGFYSCQVCGKLFPSNWKLSTHMRIHTGEKPFKCGLCGRSFNQKPHLKTHMTLVHFITVD